MQYMASQLAHPEPRLPIIIAHSMSVAQSPPCNIAQDRVGVL